MKIAFPTRDTSTITGHFGKMKALVIIDVVDGTQTAREIRDMADMPACGDGTQNRPDFVVAALSDCDVVVAGGIGIPLENRIRATGAEVVLTSVRPIDEALAAYLAGALDHQADLAHPAHH